MRPASGLLLDLYELTMAQSYVAEGMSERRATFSLFARRLPEGWGYLVAAGLEDVLGYLESLAFTVDDLAYLERTGLFEERFLSVLEAFRFGGDVRALPEGTVFSANEPVLEVDGSLLETQVVETMVLNEIHFQSLVASKAARSVDAAGGATLVDFSLRRTHRADAGIRVARSSFLAGFDATSNVLAGKLYGIPIVGTMAHSYVEAFEREIDAYEAFARSFPDDSVLLVDTYDTVEGVRRAVRIGCELAARGHRLRGVRLDSGDLLDLARRSRELLDEAGLEDATLFASGGVAEREIAELLGAGAPIAGFGVGTKLGTSADAPYLDMAYKLVEVDGRPVLKLSPGKVTLPGPKQVWRAVRDGRLAHDTVGLADESGDGEPLLRLVLRDGERVAREPLGAARERCRRERELLPGASRRIDAKPYDVRVSGALAALRDEAEAEARAR